MKKLLSVLLILASFHSFGQRLVLNVPQFSQMRTNWCWAACAQMIDQYHTNGTSTYDQCKIVNLFLSEKIAFLPSSTPASLSTCCTTCTCDVTATLDNMLIPYSHPVGIFHGVTLHTVLVGLGYYSTMDKKIDIAGIKREIDKCTPMILGYLHIGGGRHIVVVKGYDYSPSANMLVINDPIVNTPECKNCKLVMVNFDAIKKASASSPSSCVKQAEYFLGGIYRKDFTPCDTCNRYIHSPYEESVAFSKPESGYAMAVKKTTILQSESYEDIIKRLSNQANLKIPVSYISFPLLNDKIATFDNIIHSQQDTDYYYYQNDNINVLTKQVVDGKLMITQVKSCGYPLKYTIFSKSGKDSIQIDLLKGDYKFEVIRAPEPFFIDFYKFTNKEGKVFIVPSNNYNGLYFNKKKPLLALHEFHKKCLLKQLRKLFADIYKAQLAEGLFSETLLNNSKSYKQWQKSLK